MGRERGSGGFVWHRFMFLPYAISLLLISADPQYLLQEVLLGVCLDGEELASCL
jgi:hypothetical protein